MGTLSDTANGCKNDKVINQRKHGVPYLCPKLHSGLSEIILIHSEGLKYTIIFIPLRMCHILSFKSKETYRTFVRKIFSCLIALAPASLRLLLLSGREYESRNRKVLGSISHSRTQISFFIVCLSVFH